MKSGPKKGDILDCADIWKQQISKERHLKIENTRGADGHFGVMGFSIIYYFGLPVHV